MVIGIGIRIMVILHKHCLLLAPFSTRHMQENSVVFTMLCVENKLFGDWNRSQNRGDWNRSRNRGDWNRIRITITIPHMYVDL